MCAEIETAERRSCWRPIKIKINSFRWGGLDLKGEKRKWDWKKKKKIKVGTERRIKHVNMVNEANGSKWLSVFYLFLSLSVSTGFPRNRKPDFRPQHKQTFDHDIKKKKLQTFTGSSGLCLRVPDYTETHTSNVIAAERQQCVCAGESSRCLYGIRWTRQLA